MRLLGEHFKRNGHPKRDYGSHAVALAAMVRDGKGSAYRCKFCGGWHVAGRAGRRKEGRRGSE